MKASVERIQYITEYIVSYKTKIEHFNRHGLFDTATLYEIFAQKICEIWFNQKFSNLNAIKANYSYIDLISKDGKIFVQVSTVQDVPAKVKSTLEKIRDSKSSEFQNINEVFFFVLSNDSVGKVKDYIDSYRIGNVNFTKEANLITSDDILQKAKTDIDFQIALYNFLQSENDYLIQTGEKFGIAVKLSKTLIKNNIDCCINDEYVIDRSEEIRQIREENLNFISIQGEAGSGKSALCRMMIEDEELLLYARAERISESRTMEEIWDLDLNKVIKYISHRKLTIYIDALEFIADCSKTKLDLLQQIYETVKEHNNIYVVTSCRTCDRTAFVKIENNYNIKGYNVSLLTDNQIIDVAKRYKIVQELWNAKSYTQLLRSPFYLNLLIKKIKNLKEIGDVNEFRNYIWTEVMCLGGKTLPYGVTRSDIRNAVEKIVFDRAGNFLTGVKKRDIGDKEVEILLSENIVTLCTDNTIRLKYDIFEDICFERYIDEYYDNCKNDYDVFFSNIESLGRCIYRRYQIWVENKLLSKENREKFLYKLLETDKIPTRWKTQTIVGILKSNFCSDFFKEYKDSISSNLLWEFVKLTNNFAFEVTIINFKHKNVYSHLKPIGMGRCCLINLIYDNRLYKENHNKSQILKLCSDYSIGFSYSKEAMNSACAILEYYVEQKIKFATTEHFHLAEDINECLLPIYRMAETSKGWIEQFWSNRISGYLKNGGKHSIDEKIIKYVLKNAVPALAEHLPKELCEIADAYWIKTPECDKKEHYYSRDSLTHECGLSSQVDSYLFDFRNAFNNAFLNILIQYNFVAALEWLIRLTNHVADYMKKSFPEKAYDINVRDDFHKQKKSFIYISDFWLAGIQDGSVNELVGDGIYLFTKMAINEINAESNDEKIVKEFAKHIKTEIMNKANNAIMLSVIAEIGRNCEEIIPGYSLFLASSIDLVMIDSQKFRLLLPNEDRQLYERLILMTMGIPTFDKRYDIKARGDNSLQTIIVKSQLLGGELKEEAEDILDYLYSIIPNQGKNAALHLQIQKMDLRKAAVSRIDEQIFSVIPEITGEAKKIVKENEQSEYNRERNAFQEIVTECNSLLAEDNFGLQECIDIIERLQSLIKNSVVPGQLQKILVMMIAYALSEDELTVEKRSELCGIWLDGIDDIFANGSFVFDYVLLKVLYKQIENELTVEISERMKKQMLECILFRGQNGIIANISTQLKEYLSRNDILAQCLFNTIIAISEDNMAEYQYNVSKLSEVGETIDYQPNRMKPPTWVKEIFRKNGIGFYKSDKENIIRKYLFREKTRDFSNWNIEDCDIQVLCYISNCGLNFDNKNFSMVMKTMFVYMMSVISTEENYHNYLDVYAVNEVKIFITKCLTDNKYTSAIIDMLFNQIDFAEFNSDAYEVYEEVACHMLAIYFDGHNNADVRRQCETLLERIENKISTIANVKAKNKLYAMMFLTLGRYHMGDWNEIDTSYAYKDKVFLNKIWIKYGWLHFGNLLQVIDQMHITELLPEVLIPLNESLQKYKTNISECKRTIKENEFIINKIITKAFLDFNDEIKADKELTQSFEGFLEVLVDFNMEEAAVIIDEFRVH